MASKSKDVRMEQLRIFEKKLDLRLQQLAKKEISKEQAQRDPLVKNLKSKIRETNVRIAAFDKFVKLNNDLAQAKVQKLADLVAKKDEKSESAPEAKQTESKPKKKEAADKEPKKQSVGKDETTPKEPKKQAAASDEATPKKPKKQPTDADEAAPKKRTSKKKEE